MVLTNWLPNASGVGRTVPDGRWPSPISVTVIGTFRGLLGSVSVTLNAAVFGPTPAAPLNGWKVRVIVQLAPAARFPPQLLLRVNGFAFAPVSGPTVYGRF